MMSPLNTFWTYLSLVFVVVLSLLALAIWNASDHTPSNTPKAISETAPAVSTSATPAAKASADPIPSEFPAPAKQLHQWIRDIKQQTDTAQVLDENVKQWNQLLADINQALNAQGIHSPQPQPLPSPNREIEQRLNAIKDHISKNQQQ